MKLSDVPEYYKIYTLAMSNGSKYEINGTQKTSIMEATTAWIELQNGTVINKSFLVEMKLNKDETRENVQEHAKEIKNALITA